MISVVRERTQRAGSTSRPGNDAGVAGGAAGGDEAALEELFRRYSGPCYGLAKRILRDDSLAEDVVQETFLACWRGGGYDSARGSVASWLLAITHHKAVDLVRKEERLRSRRASDDTLTELAASSPSPEDQTWLLLRAAAVQGALKDLPPSQREVLLLAYYGGYSQSEISSITGVPLGTVKTRTLSGMRRLRAALADPLAEEGGAR